MKSEKKVYAYKLKGITLVEKFLDSSRSPSGAKPLEYNVYSNAVIDKENKLFIQRVKVDIREKGSKVVSGSVAIACAFTVTGDNEIFSDANTENEINLDVEIGTRQESLSTLRGVVFCEFRGTSLNNAMLPLISVESMKRPGD